MQGQYDDGATGLYYNMFRYYDADAGRYSVEDPIRLTGGLNLYTYVDGNPVKWTDPWGLASCKLTMSEGRLACTPSNPQNSAVDIPVASGNNGDGQQCRNNPNCATIHNHGPIPLGHWQWTNGQTAKPNGRVLEPVPGTNTNVAEQRNSIRSHSCANPFGPGISSPFCSEGCVTGTVPDIQQLNNLIDAEPGSTLDVVP
jgi:RHS repeat-associated protein